MSSGQPRSGAGRFIIIMGTLPMLHIAYSEAARAVVGVFMSVIPCYYCFNPKILTPGHAVEPRELVIRRK